MEINSLKSLGKDIVTVVEGDAVGTTTVTKRGTITNNRKVSIDNKLDIVFFTWKTNLSADDIMNTTVECPISINTIATGYSISKGNFIGISAVPVMTSISNGVISNSLLTKGNMVITLFLDGNNNGVGDTVGINAIVYIKRVD